MQRIIMKAVWTRRGVANFERLVNEHLSEGWVARDVSMSVMALRVLCMALLETPGDQLVSGPELQIPGA